MISTFSLSTISVITGSFTHCIFNCRVAFGPSDVTILGNRPVLANTDIRLICRPDGTNPAATIQWIEPDYSDLPEHARCPIGTICNHVRGRYKVSFKSCIPGLF